MLAVAREVDTLLAAREEDVRRAGADPAVALGRVRAVVARTPDGARATWRADPPTDLRVRVNSDDLTEALGALVENAARHAATEVRLSAAARCGAVEIRIEDDRPGAPQELIARMVARGARADERGPGDGLGLAIAREIAEAAGGRLMLRNLDPGLAAVLTLPSAPNP